MTIRRSRSKHNDDKFDENNNDRKYCNLEKTTLQYIGK